MAVARPVLQALIVLFHIDTLRSDRLFFSQNKKASSHREVLNDYLVNKVSQ